MDQQERLVKEAPLERKVIQALKARSVPLVLKDAMESLVILVKEVPPVNEVKLVLMVKLDLKVISVKLDLKVSMVKLDPKEGMAKQGQLVVKDRKVLKAHKANQAATE